VALTWLVFRPGPPLEPDTLSSQKEWWRRGESHYNVPLRTRKLLILRRAQDAKSAQNANRRYTAGTRTDFDYPPFRHLRKRFVHIRPRMEQSSVP